MTPYVSFQVQTKSLNNLNLVQLYFLEYKLYLKMSEEESRKRPLESNESSSESDTDGWVGPMPSEASKPVQPKKRNGS